MAAGEVVPILIVLVPALPSSASETLPTACTLMWFPYVLDVQVPLLYVPLTAVKVENEGLEYSRNVTVFVVAFVRPRESVTVTVTVFFPADRTEGVV